MNVSKGYGDTQAGPALCPSSDAYAPEMEIVEAPKAWVVAYSHIGLINIVAESQEELVERINEMRVMGGHVLQQVEVANNKPEVSEVSTIWIDPYEVQMVLEEYHPRAHVAPEAGFLPPGLEELLKSAGATPVAGKPEETAEVQVKPDPDDPPGGGDHE